MESLEILFTISGSIFGYDSRIDENDKTAYGGGATAVAAFFDALKELYENRKDF